MFGSDGEHGLWRICRKQRGLWQKRPKEKVLTVLLMVAVSAPRAQALCLLRPTAARGEQQSCSSTESVLKGEVCMIKMRMCQSRAVRATHMATWWVQAYRQGENYKLLYQIFTA